FGIKSPTLLNDCAGSVNALSHTGNYLILANVLAKGLSALSGLESLPEPRLGLFQRISHAAVGNAVNGPAPVLPSSTSRASAGWLTLNHSISASHDGSGDDRSSLMARPFTALKNCFF